MYPAVKDPEIEKETTPLPTYPQVMQLNGDHDDATTGIWQRGKGILACNRRMLDNQLACDIWFTLGPQREKVGAHRYMLQSRSGVFYAMLDGPGADRTHIDLPDVQPTVFWHLLRYMYYEELYPEPDTVLGLLSLTEKYDLVTANHVCLRFLRSCLTVNMACDILETAHRHNDRDLETEVMLFICKHGEVVLHTEGLERLCRECLNKVLTAEGLEINPTLREEITDRWARKRCEDNEQEPSDDNKRVQLGDVVYVKRDAQKSRRYILNSCTEEKLSPVDDPSDAPPLYSDLSMDGREDIPDTASIAPVSTVGSRHSVYSQISRQQSFATWPDLNNITRFREVGDTVVNNGTADAVSFTVDRNIYLYGFGIYGSKKPGEVSFKVDTIVTRKKKDFLMESISIKGTGVILPVMFERPIKIDKAKSYTLEIYLHGPDCYRGVEGVAKARDGQTTFTFSKAANIKGNRTTDKMGQIPRLFFMPYGK